MSIDRRGFLATAIGSAVLPSSLMAQQEWTNSFVQKWMLGSWLATPQGGAKPFLMEFYSERPSHEERGAIVLRGGASWADHIPERMQSAIARPNSSGAQVTVATPLGRCDVAWQASETQTGQATLQGSVVPVTLRRQSTAEIDAQRNAVLHGEKPIFINVSYFG